MIGEFFIALFGGLYHAGNYLANKGAAYQANSRFSQRVLNEQEKIKQVTDIELETKIFNKIKYENQWITSEITEECDRVLKDAGLSISRDYISIGWYNYCQEEKAYPYRCFQLAILRILLSQYGKIPSADVHGISVINYYQEKEYTTQWKFMQLWDKLLQNKGIPPMKCASLDTYSRVIPGSSSLVSAGQKYSVRPQGSSQFYWFIF